MVGQLPDLLDVVIAKTELIGNKYEHKLRHFSSKIIVALKDANSGQAVINSGITVAINNPLLLSKRDRNSTQNEKSDYAYLFEINRNGKSLLTFFPSQDDYKYLEAIHIAPFSIGESNPSTNPPIELLNSVSNDAPKNIYMSVICPQLLYGDKASY